MRNLNPETGNNPTESPLADKARHHEQLFIHHCVKKNLQDRAREVLLSPTAQRNPKRSKLLQKLPHGELFDLASLDCENVGKLSGAQLITKLQQAGAPETCYVLSASSEFDGTFQPLAKLLPTLVATGYGIVLSLIAGKLWYYESEEKNGRYIIRA